jgi:hypothetical protein
VADTVITGINATRNSSKGITITAVIVMTGTTAMIAMTGITTGAVTINSRRKGIKGFDK